MTGRAGAAPRALVQLALRALCDVDARSRLATACADPDLDWSAVCHLAKHERVAPLLHLALRDCPALPADAAAALRDAYHETARCNLLFRHELGGVLRALDAAAIPVLVLKGAALSDTVYPSIAVRPMSDLDLLVRRPDVTRAFAVLSDLGFAEPRIQTRAGAGAYESQYYVYKESVAPVPLELHWSLFDSPYYQYALSMDWFWETAESADIADTRARMLGREAQVLHLCGHLRLHHGGDELLWLHDVAQVIGVWGARIDWQLVLEQARRFDLVLSLRDVLGRVARDWGAAVPSAVLQQLRGVSPSRREARVFGWLTQPDRSVAQRLWIDLASLPSWSRRIGFAWIHLFPSAHYMRQRYGVAHALLVPFYYPYRWLRALRGAR